MGTADPCATATHAEGTVDPLAPTTDAGRSLLLSPPLPRGGGGGTDPRTVVSIVRVGLADPPTSHLLRVVNPPAAVAPEERGGGSARSCRSLP